MIGHYVHNAVGDGLGKIGVIVGARIDRRSRGAAPLGRQIAMHVAAASPLGLDAARIDPAMVEREKAVLADKNAGKPAHVLEKIVDSGLKTYYKEVSLLDQTYIHDGPRRSPRPSRRPRRLSARPIGQRASRGSPWARGSRSRDTPDFASEVASMV